MYGDHPFRVVSGIRQPYGPMHPLRVPDTVSTGWSNMGFVSMVNGDCLDYTANVVVGDVVYVH